MLDKIVNFGSSMLRQVKFYSIMLHLNHASFLGFGSGGAASKAADLPDFLTKKFFLKNNITNITKLWKRPATGRFQSDINSDIRGV